MIYNREKRDELERLTLAPYATLSGDSRGRAHPEPESTSRTAFQRDRDRIIHTTAFRRLEYKTQVFVTLEGDHYRTRLTHTLEVAQLGRSIAAGLGANTDLTEAICLAHDLGHPPFGHAGEGALNRLMQQYSSSFNHNTQSYRIITLLENRYPNFPGLNLTYETRAGMLKHETTYDKSEATQYEPHKRPSLEAQITNFADPIAYDSHDLDDGLRAGLFTPDELEELELWRELRQRIQWDGKQFNNLIRHQLIRELVGLLVSDVVMTTSAILTAEGIDAAAKVETHPTTVVHFSPEVQTRVKQLKGFLYERMYRHYRLMRMQAKAERFVTELFEAYVKEPRMLPTETKKRLTHTPLPQVVTDYIAGMTDRYALQEWQRLFDPFTLA
ncbi:MAG: deoxyguanosinetriphosphate triphosphohydrolase [Chloroflexi bacterium]|nr:deoxyguanosinetriphosphate triphosphohydrolase [Chloroflexota bacterium]MBP8057894.1 deoxyguanosinetriphosphate triphosphohydrolase [Chloroflexota bacterium]